MKLKEWDKSTLKKWDKLQTSQQEKLQSVRLFLRSPSLSAPQASQADVFAQMGVPTFQPTRDQTVLKRQERVMKVLIGFIEDREDA